ncbi:hypothetical protein FACS1894180_2870 [Bacteroidia bacterium]|nr:hypothetical protein FACS1894180_2870 [Bacteroidia bacterium]
MITIKSSTELRNNYNAISEHCKKYSEPVFITKNGDGDLAVMSIATYEQLIGQIELYSQLSIGLNDIKHRKTNDFKSFLKSLNN